MRSLVKVGVLVPAVMLLASGCVATRDWVRESMGKQEVVTSQKIAKVEGRVGEEAGRIDREGKRIDAVEVRVKEEAQRVEGMGFRVKTLETTVVEVGETAKGAKERADAAFAKAEGVEGKFNRFATNRHARNVVDTVQVTFGFDRWELTDGAQTALLALVKELKENPKLTVDLSGYTDQAGTPQYNVGLSQRRVEAVRRYLVDQGVELPRINSVGLGQFPDRGKGEEAAKQRRVTVNLMLYPE